MSPAYAKGLYVSGLSTSGLSAVFLALSLFEVLRRRLKVKTAPLAALVTVLGTPLFPYATSFFGHTIAGAFLFAAFALVDPLGPASTRKRLAGAGALLVLAGGSEYVVFAPAVFVALYAILKAPEARRIETALFLAAGAALPLALLSAYHSLCFGAPWRTGYAFITNPEFAPGQAQGLFGITYPRLEALYGVLFGSSRGLLYLSPLCAVALVAAWLHRRDRDPALSVGILVFAILLLINASYYRWEGGLSTGPRHLVPALGFLGVAIGLSFEQPNLRTIAAVAAGVSCSIMILITALAVEVPPNIDAIFDYLLPQFEQGFVAHITGASNLGIAVGLGRKASVVPPLVWAMAGGVFVARLSARSTPESPSGDDP